MRGSSSRFGAMLCTIGLAIGRSHQARGRLVDRLRPARLESQAGLRARRHHLQPADSRTAGDGLPWGQNEKRTPAKAGALLREIRRRPTLPGRIHPSTIGAVWLNFRVRDGNGCDPDAIVTEICCQGRAPTNGAQALEDSIASTNFIVNPSPRPISTGRLNVLPRLHLRPINVLVYHGPYLVNPVGNLI